jgi:DNA-binding CsgD family transcriptional regulator
MIPAARDRVEIAIAHDRVHRLRELQMPPVVAQAITRLSSKRMMRPTHHDLISRPWKRTAGKVGGACAEQTEELMRGVQSAAKGRRLMLTLRDGGDVLPVASVPLSQPCGGDPASVLLILGRQSGTGNLAVTFYSRQHGLTPAEESVLKGLCDGMDVHEIAIRKRVSECTIRTQLRSLRDKTGATSMRLLVQRVAALPPVIPLALAMDGGLGRLHTS